MKKYFVISDIHSFYIEMRSALMKAGFRKSNPDHILIVVGDAFDRGPDTLKVYNYIHSLPKSRRILIKGNHESLFLELLAKKKPEGHDFHNHTTSTFCQIADEEEWKIEICKYNSEYLFNDDDYKNAIATWSIIREQVKKHPITKWLKSKEWRDYYELDRFIFTHSFIPVTLKPEYSQFKWWPTYEINPKCYQYDPEWRNGYWEDARWGNPWLQYKLGLFQPEEDQGKTLVVGHWHTSDFFENLKNKHVDFPGPIYYSKGLIGLDGGCAYDYYHDIYSHPQNVMVIDENFNCFDQDGIPLQEVKAVPIIRTVTLDENGNEIGEPSKDFIEE